MSIQDRLRGGNRRSIGQADEVAAEILAELDLFGDVFSGLAHQDPVVRMRAADVVEKVSRTRPEYLEPYRRRLLDEFMGIAEPAVRWHIALLIPRLDLSAEETMWAARRFLSWIDSSPSQIVRVNSLQALAELARSDPALRDEALGRLKECLRTGSPSLRSRARKLLGEMEGLLEGAPLIGCPGEPPESTETPDRPSTDLEGLHEGLDPHGEQDHDGQRQKCGRRHHPEDQS